MIRRPTASTVPLASPKSIDVADAVLVLEHHEDAGQEVLDDVLRAEAERDADDAGRGDDRREVDPELAEDQHERDARRPANETNDRSTEPIVLRPLAAPFADQRDGLAAGCGGAVAQRAQDRRPLAGAVAAGQPRIIRCIRMRTTSAITPITRS